MKIAIIHNSKKVSTGAHYINDLISMKMKARGVEVKNFYPKRDLVDAPRHLRGLRNILFFYSLLEHRNQILKCDIVQGTTYTPLTFLAFPIPVISHFGSTTQGFLSLTPRTHTMREELKGIWHFLRKNKIISELNIKTRRPLRDIAEIEQYVAVNSDMVIATSNHVRHELLQSGVNDKKISVIHNAIEDFWFENTIKSEVSETPKIIFLGRIGDDVFTFKLKGIDRLIEMYKKYNKVEKYIFGISRHSRLTTFLTEELENTNVLINMKKEQILEKLKSCYGSILFIPSRYEGFSLSLIEGMSQGLIPVVFPVGVAPEIIVNGKNGFLVSSQKEAMQAIQKLLKDKKLRKKMAKHAQETAFQFQADVMVDKFIHLYEKVIRKS